MSLMLEIIFVLIGVIFVASFGIYCVKSANKNKKFEDSLMRISVPTYHLTYNSINHKFAFYSKANGKSETFQLEDFEASIHTSDIENWRRWFSNARTKKLANNDYLIIKMRLPFNKSTRTMKIFYKENRKNNYVFSLRDVSAMQDKLETASLFNVTSDFNDFKSEVELKAAKRKLEKTGALIFINIRRFTHIYERYGTDVAKIISSRIKYRLIPYTSKKISTVSFTNDNYLIYVADMIFPSEIKSFVSHLNNILTKEIEVDNCKFNIKFSYGVSVYGEFSNDFNKVLDQATLAEKKAKDLNGLKFIIYDESFEKEAKKLELCNKEVMNVVYDNQVQVKYHPLIDNKKGNIYGFECEYYPYDTMLLDKNLIISQALSLGVVDQLKVNIYRKMIFTYLKRKMAKRHRLMISMGIEDLSLFTDFYYSEPACSEVKLMVVLDIQKNLKTVRNNSTLSENVKKLFDEGVEIGIRVNDKILKEYLSIFDNVLYVLYDITATDNLLIKSYKEKFGTMKMIATHVDNVNAFMKSMEFESGICMGELVGRNYPRPMDLENKNYNMIMDAIESNK